MHLTFEEFKLKREEQQKVSMLRARELDERMQSIPYIDNIPLYTYSLIHLAYLLTVEGSASTI